MGKLGRSQYMKNLGETERSIRKSYLSSPTYTILVLFFREDQCFLFRFQVNILGVCYLSHASRSIRRAGQHIRERPTPCPCVSPGATKPGGQPPGLSRPRCYVPPLAKAQAPQSFSYNASCTIISLNDDPLVHTSY